LSDQSKQHIEDALNRIRVIFSKTEEKLEKVKPGEKIKATGLAGEIAKEFGVTGATIYPILKYLFDDYPEIEIKKGAKGGLRRLSKEEISKKNQPQIAIQNDNPVKSVLDPNDPEQIALDKQPQEIINS